MSVPDENTFRECFYEKMILKENSRKELDRRSEFEMDKNHHTSLTAIKDLSITEVHGLCFQMEKMSICPFIHFAGSSTNSMVYGSYTEYFLRDKGKNIQN